MSFSEPKVNTNISLKQLNLCELHKASFSTFAKPQNSVNILRSYILRNTLIRSSAVDWCSVLLQCSDGLRPEPTD